MSAIQIKQRPFITRPELFQDIPAFIAEILARRGGGVNAGAGVKAQAFTGP